MSHVLEAEGDYSLPEVTIHWWDTNRSRLRTEILPEREFKVALNPNLDPEQLAGFVEQETVESEVAPETDWRSFLWQGALAAGGSLALIWIWFPVRRILQWIGHFMAAYRERRAQSEETYFNRVRRAALLNDAAGTMRHLMFWLDRVNDEPGAAMLSGFVEKTRSQELHSEAARASDILYSAAGRDRRSWTGKGLAKALEQACRIGFGGSSGFRGRAEELAPLNPLRQHSS